MSKTEPNNRLPLHLNQINENQHLTGDIKAEFQQKDQFKNPKPDLFETNSNHSQQSYKPNSPVVDSKTELVSKPNKKRLMYSEAIAMIEARFSAKNLLSNKPLLSNQPYKKENTIEIVFLKRKL